jgi:hypothetical protein
MTLTSLTTTESKNHKLELQIEQINDLFDTKCPHCESTNWTPYTVREVQPSPLTKIALRCTCGYYALVPTILFSDLTGTQN